MGSKLLTFASLILALGHQVAAGSSQCDDAPYDGYLALSGYSDAVAYCTAQYPAPAAADGHDPLEKRGAPKCRRRYVKSESELKEMWSECRDRGDDFVSVVCACIVPKNPKPWTTTSSFTTPADNYATTTSATTSESTTSTSTTEASSTTTSESTSKTTSTTTSESTTATSGTTTSESTTSASTTTSTSESTSSSSTTTESTTSSLTSSSTTTSSSSSSSSSTTTTMTTTSSSSTSTSSSTTTTTSSAPARCTNGNTQLGPNCYNTMCNTVGATSDAPYRNIPNVRTTSDCLMRCDSDTRCRVADLVISTNECLLYDATFDSPGYDGNNDIILKVSCTTSSSTTTSSSSSSTTTTMTTTSSSSSSSTSSSTTTTSSSAPARCTNGIMEVGALCYETKCNTNVESSGPQYNTVSSPSPSDCLAKCANDPNTCTFAKFAFVNNSNACLLFTGSYTNPTSSTEYDTILVYLCAQ